MASYAYKCRDEHGVLSQGILEGESRAGAVQQLRKKGFTVINIKEKAVRKSTKNSFQAGRRIKARQVALFTRQFATMISAGLALLRSLYILEGQIQNPNLKATIGSVRDDVERGASLSGALEKHPRVFNHLYVGMVRVGEAGGMLDDVLKQIASQLEAEDSLKRQVRSAMVYPLLISVFAMVVLVAMIIFIIPIFSKMYEELGGQLPLLTRIMVAISDTMRSFTGFFVVAALAGAVYGIVRLKRTPRGTAAWDRTKLNIPLGIGEIIRKVVLARFSRTLSTLITSGVPILLAIEITGDSAGNIVIARAMDGIKQSVREGRPMSEPLSRNNVFPEMVTQMIAVGEETGTLGGMLNKIAEFYEDEVRTSIKSLTSIVEPVMMIGVGALVGLIVISLYLPIFNIMTVVK